MFPLGKSWPIVSYYYDAPSKFLFSLRERPTVTYVFWGGDFNTVLDLNPDATLNIDHRNRFSHPGPKVALELAIIRSDHSLFDAYREI